MPVESGLPPEGRSACNGGDAARQLRLIGPVDPGKIRIIAQLHGSSTVHEDSKEQNDRQRDADEPKQRTFSESHDRLHLMFNWRCNSVHFLWFRLPRGDGELARPMDGGANRRKDNASKYRIQSPVRLN